MASGGGDVILSAASAANEEIFRLMVEQAQRMQQQAQQARELRQRATARIKQLTSYKKTLGLAAS